MVGDVRAHSEETEELEDVPAVLGGGRLGGRTAPRGDGAWRNLAGIAAVNRASANAVTPGILAGSRSAGGRIASEGSIVEVGSWM